MTTIQQLHLSLWIMQIHSSWKDMGSISKPRQCSQRSYHQQWCGKWLRSCCMQTMMEDFSAWGLAQPPKSVTIWGMKIHWNTTLAEISSGIELKPVNLLVLPAPIQWTLLWNYGAHSAPSLHSVQSPTSAFEALNQWVDIMEQNLTGKAKATAGHNQKSGAFLKRNGNH